MAEQEDPENKTEDPSQKRLDEAREKGNIAKSIEINSWFVLAGAFLALTLSFGGPVGTMSPGLSSIFSVFIAFDAASLCFYSQYAFRFFDT